MNSTKSILFRQKYQVVFLAIAFTLTLGAQSPSTATSDTGTGQMRGIVTSALDQTAVAAATVSAFLIGSTPAFSTSAVTGLKGNFILNGLIDGAYGVCVSDKRAVYLDQCQWPDLHTTVVVSKGQIVSGLNLQLRGASAINIRVNDSGQVLTKTFTDHIPPHVNAGVFDMHGMFHPAPEVGRDATGISFQLVVPIGVPMQLSVSSGTVALETEQKLPVASNGVAGGVMQQQAQPRTFTFNTVSRK